MAILSFQETNDRISGLNHLRNSSAVVVMPVCSSDELHGARRIKAKCAQIEQCRRLFRITANARIYDSPMPITKMDHNAFAEAWTEDTNFNLIRPWNARGCHFGKGHYTV